MRTPIPGDLYGTLTWRIVVVKKREAHDVSHDGALRRSFETHCYNEHGAGFHVCPFDENGNELVVTDEDKAKWDVLWRMESEKFDEECSKVPEYQNLAIVNRKFSTWDGNHQVITWIEVSTSPERTQRMAWHPRVRCVILVPLVHAYKQIEVAMHNLNASSHATVQYDWIQDAERCLQVLSTPLNAYKDMIGDDVYDEFEKSRMKTPVNRPWYNVNMTSMAAAYILSFAEVTAAKEAHRATEEAEEKRQGKSLTAKAKKALWDAKVKDVCNTWYNAVFKYATIINPQLGPEFLASVRELHNTLAKTDKAKRPVTYSVVVDRVKAFAFAGIHKSLKIEFLRAHYSDVTVKNRYHHPVNNDVDKDVRPWLAQWSLWSAMELLSSDLIKKIGKRNLANDMTPEEITSKLEEDVDRFLVFLCDTRDKFWAYLWFPVDERQDVSVNVQRAKRIVFR
ncbi:hypothetical protein R1sor_026661 [Riccia sorocarpa]|uniref:Uncharacterized protein n=1 Tax=Riccia sorocarpa TaxID=122646 RepID=A0ABD3GC13_9MARC